MKAPTAHWPWLRAVTGCIALACSLHSHASEPQRPWPDAVPAGQGIMRFWGMEIYHAQLWTPPRFDATRWEAAPLALTLTYQRAFDAQAIARRSLQEMQRQGPMPDAQAQQWETQLRAALPSVQAGDRVTGLYRPGQAVQFLLNGKPHGQVTDPAFGPRFFGIWLAPQTSEPQLREALLANAAR